MRAQPDRPNILLIVGDDIGYEAVGANGGTSYETPTLDRLAQTGLRFTHAYAQPLCSPTRASILTGKYSARHGITSATGHQPPQAPGYSFLPATAPANRPVIIKLRSKDVIHSFGVPEFRVKQDAIPGLTIPVWFIPNVTTEEMRARKGNPDFQYEIACAQLCGLGHARMRGFVTVQTADEFQKWMEGELAQQSAPDPFQ